MTMTVSIIALTLAIAVCLVHYSRRRAIRRPPGPNPLPIIGNILDMPKTQEWLTFTDWKKNFGDLVYVTVMGQDIVVCNSTKTAVDLLEKRSAIYSDRPYMAMAGELVGWDQSVVLLPYGERLRETRKLLHPALNPHAIEKYHSLQEHHARVLLQRCINDADGFMDHIRFYIVSIILKISYGYEVRAQDDHLVDLVDRTMREFVLAGTPGTFMVDFLPFLRHLPAWLPGMGFKRAAERWRKNRDTMYEAPWTMVEQAVGTGMAEPSFAQNLIENRENPTEEDLDMFKWAAIGIYGGGSDTSISAISTAFLALTCHPEVQVKARAEIDTVVGRDRLPTFSDRSNLPYVEAVLKEVLRWHPVLPLGIAHRLTQDDVYETYHLTKGTLVMPNIWGILHDAETYGPDPMEFDPERFLGPETQPDPHASIFGYGRRICAGMHLADQSIWLALVTVLASLELKKPTVNGNAVEPEVGFTPGTISHPKPFKCDIRPRSSDAERLVHIPVEQL